MYREPISSSAIRTVGHDGGDVLELEFSGGSIANREPRTHSPG